MFNYYLDLALRSFRKNRVLTTLMIVAIALGIGATMTTLTVFHVLSGDPIPDKSDRLFYVQLDSEGMHGYQPGSEPQDQLTRHDAEALLRDRRGKRQAVMTAGGVVLSPEDSSQNPQRIDARYTSGDFFPMFNVPFLYGTAWSARDDDARSRVVVISRELNETLFGGANSVGRTIRLNSTDLRIIGVIDDWKPVPRFYDLSIRQYGEMESVFLPFSTAMSLKFPTSGNTNCWGDTDGDNRSLNAPCAWLQYWVELDSPADASRYRDYLASYSDQQRKAGWFERPVNVRLRNVMEWLQFKRVVPSDVRLQVWLAFGFLVACLVNTIGLMLAKFLRRSGEIGVRRALGASRGDIFWQCLVEAGTVGLAGGLLGLAIALLGLWAVRHQPVGYAELARLDTSMLLLTFAISVGASLLAGILPAWRAMRITPAVQLKTQ